MRIESGTTGERRTRIAVFVVICAVMSAWFAYDGFKRYPAKNLDPARQAMPEEPQRLWINPRATVANLKQLTKGMTVEEVIERVGEPILVQPRRLIFTGSEHKGVVATEDGKVSAVTVKPVDSAARPEMPNVYVTEARIKLVKPGMDQVQVQDLLRERNPKEEKKTLWFVGPAAYVKVQVEEGKVVAPLLFKMGLEFENDLDRGTISENLKQRFERERATLTLPAARESALSPGATVSIQKKGERWLVLDDNRRYLLIKEGNTINAYIGELGVVESIHYSESDILGQKVIAAGLAFLSVGVLIKLYLVIRTHVVVDDAGLTMNGKHIAWEAMTDLVADRYQDKGWVDLNYSANGARRSVRLDSYHIHRFNEIINAICERKGYESPIGRGRDHAPAEPPAG